MNVYFRLVSHNFRSIKTFRLQTKQLTEISLKCLYSSSVGQKSLSIQDIKRKAMKNLNQSQESNRNYNREVDIFEGQRHEYYKNIAIFSFFNYLLWVYLANFGLHWYLRENRHEFDNKLDDKTEEKKGFFNDMLQSFYEKKYYIGLSAVFILIGHIILSVGIMFNTRVVYRMRLIPTATGANRVLFHCYSPFGLPNTVHKHEVLVEHMSAKRHRLSPSGKYIPIKVKGKFGHFLVDKKGYFSHPMLFDETVGVYKKF